MRIILFIYFLLICQMAIGQKSLSIQQALRKGLMNNYGIRISDENVLLAKKDEKIFRSSTLPTIDLSIRQSNRYEVDNSPTSFVEGDYTQSGADVALDFDWVLFDGFRAKVEKDKLKKLTLSTEGETQLLVENTVEVILLAYYRAVLEREKLDVFKEVAAQSKDRYTQEEFLLNNGTRSLFDVLTLKTAWVKDSISYINQLLVADLAEDDLKFAMGSKSDDTITLTDGLEVPLKQYDLRTLEKNLVSNNQDIKLQYINLELQELNRKALAADRYPTVRLNSSISQDFNSSRFADEDRERGSAFGLNGGFRIGMNLYNGGRVKELLKKNKVEERVALLQIEELEYRLKDELGDAYEQYQFNDRIINKHDELLRILDQTLNIAKDRLSGGYATPLEYRTVQLDYLQSNLEQLEAIFSLKSAEITMMRLTGGISRSEF